MMNYSSSRILTSMHPSIRHLNIRNVAKIVASKIICNTQLQLQYNPDFCRQLGVSTYLNTHIGLAYFIDDRYFDHYGLLGTEKTPVNWQRLLGGVVIFIGVLLTLQR